MLAAVEEEFLGPEPLDLVVVAAAVLVEEIQLLLELLERSILVVEVEVVDRKSVV